MRTRTSNMTMNFLNRVQSNVCEARISPPNAVITSTSTPNRTGKWPPRMMDTHRSDKPVASARLATVVVINFVLRKKGHLHLLRFITKSRGRNLNSELHKSLARRRRVVAGLRRVAPAGSSEGGRQSSSAPSSMAGGPRRHSRQQRESPSFVRTRTAGKRDGSWKSK